MNLELIKEGRFEYFEYGHGPKTLVLLHGLFGELSNFNEVFKYFSNEYRVIMPVLPIFRMPLINLNLQHLSHHIRRFVKFKKLNDFVLISNSLGGHLGIIFSLKHPEYVKGLVLTGSSGLYENTFGNSYFQRRNYDVLKERVKQTFYDPALASDELVKKCFDIVNNRLKVIRVIAIARSALKNNLENDLPNLKVKTIIIWGKNDIITPPYVAEDFHRLIKGSELYFLDKCGHVPMMEIPEQFNPLLEKWLNKIFNEQKPENN